MIDNNTLALLCLDDERIGTDIFVDLKNTLDARSGAKVLVNYKMAEAIKSQKVL